MASVNIHDHGVAVDKKKSRVRCNYCGKVMSGFFRLKCHLGGIRRDVVPCEQVPEIVRESFRHKVLEKRKQSIGPVRNTNRAARSDGCENRRDVDLSVSEDSSSEEASLSDERIASRTGEDDLLTRKAQKSVGRFFFENGFDFTAVNSPSFREMLSAATSDGGDGQMRHTIPSFRDLNGWILKQELKEMQEYVNRIKDSWAITGCSILLDAWVDKNGRDLVTFIADCPGGPIYLKSLDVSDINNDIYALILLVDGIIKEVGVHNVVQVVGCSISGWVGEVGKWFAENQQQIFWSVSASHCFELMLEKIGKMDFAVDILNKVKKMSEFIYSQPSVFKLFRYHSHGKDLIASSKIKSAAPFMTLENIVMAKKNLATMFASSGWKNLICAAREEGNKLAELVEDSSFWNTAEMVLKGTLPLVHGLFLVSRSDKPQVGLIYDTVDEIKETIKEGLNNKKSHYMPFWSAVDEIWDTHLHSSLHAAGYFLNPSVFYSTDFHLDPEVATGLLCSVIRLVREQGVQLKVSQQLNEYRLCKGGFAEGSRVGKMSELSPDKWWAQYGSHQPELQRVAIKILSQTCDGASRYRLKRSLAEKLLEKEKKPLEQQHLNDLAFVHYNLHLRRCKLELSASESMEDEIDKDDEWTVNGEGWPFNSRVKVESS